MEHEIKEALTDYLTKTVIEFENKSKKFRTCRNKKLTLCIHATGFAFIFKHKLNKCQTNVFRNLTPGFIKRLEKLYYELGGEKNCGFPFRCLNVFHRFGVVKHMSLHHPIEITVNYPEDYLTDEIKYIEPNESNINPSYGQLMNKMRDAHYASLSPTPKEHGSNWRRSEINFWEKHQKGLFDTTEERDFFNVWTKGTPSVSSEIINKATEIDELNQLRQKAAALKIVVNGKVGAHPSVSNPLDSLDKLNKYVSIKQRMKQSVKKHGIEESDKPI